MAVIYHDYFYRNYIFYVGLLLKMTCTYRRYVTQVCDLFKFVIYLFKR